MLFIPLAALLSMGTTFAIVASKGTTLFAVRGTGDPYYHYEAVAATCASYGIKEYWTNCKGDTTIVEPLGVDIIERGQPSASDIQHIIDTYGAGDERIIAKSDVHGSGVESADCLGKEVCSVCGETLGGIVPTIDFSTNGIYGMYDWCLDSAFTAPDPGWVTVPSATSIQFLTYKTAVGVVDEIRLPRIYYAGFDAVSIDLTIQYQNEIYSFDELQTTSFTIPSSGYAAKLVFGNINGSSMNVSLRDSSNNVLISSVVTDSDVLNGEEGFKFYVEAYALGMDGVGSNVLSNFTFVKDCVHNFAADTNCIGKEVCSACGKERGVADPSFDFTSNLYGAYDVYEPWGAWEQAGWVASDSASAIKFYNYGTGVTHYHLPKIYFAGFSSVSISLASAYQGEQYAFDDSFLAKYETPFGGYSLKISFENITSSSMTVSILDAFDNPQVQTTCTNLDVLNGNENFVLYLNGVTSGAWETFSNLTFVA